MGIGEASTHPTIAVRTAKRTVQVNIFPIVVVGMWLDKLSKSKVAVSE